MVWVWHASFLLFTTVVLADYYIDNANTSVIYSMDPSQSGQAWQTFSVGTQYLQLGITNSSGNYNITLDASHCYDQNYALGVCGTNDNCLVRIPFVGSGITMYVFNAGTLGMTANFSVDDGPLVSCTIEPPPPPTYQVSNVSMYDVQGLGSGHHTMVMTVLDWNGGPTSMKFDYAHVNETLVAPMTSSLIPTISVAFQFSTKFSETTAQTPTLALTTLVQTPSRTPTRTPTQTPVRSESTFHEDHLGGVLGGTLGGLTLLGSIGIGFLYWRKRRAPPRESPLESTLQVDPFRAEYHHGTTPAMHTTREMKPSFAQHAEANLSVSSLERSAILRDALAASNYFNRPTRSSQSIESGINLPVLQPTQVMHDVYADLQAHPGASHVVDTGSPFSDPQIVLRRHLTAEQVEVIEQLRADHVPVETIARVVEGFVSSHISGSEARRGPVTLVESRSMSSGMPPPSYRTRVL